MWCSRCCIETNSEKCPVCGAATDEEVAVKIFRCDACNVPIINAVSDVDKGTCPLCGGKTKYFVADLRIVFPEEKLLLAILLDKKPNFFMNRSVWAAAGKYYVDGKALTVSSKIFTRTDTDSIAKKFFGAIHETNYERFNEDIDKFVRANRFRHAALKDEADNFIRHAAKNFTDERIIISFSGGKDSTVTADLVTKALTNPNLVHIFSNTTLEFPSTLDYVTRYRKNHPQAIFQTATNSEQNFFDVCEDIGPPARMMRWCCSMFKTGPIARVISSLYRDQKILTFYGIRKAESVTRSKYNRLEANADSIKIRQQTVASPIFFWKDLDVWLYIFAEKLDFNTAYRLGYDRVGCWCCPNNTQRALFLSRIFMPLETKKWRNFLVDFAKKIGKPDPENYVDAGKWKARQGGNGLVAANDVKIRFTNCTTEEHAKIYKLARPFSDELVNLFVPFGKIAPELGSKILRETLVLDLKTNVPILSIMPFKQGTAVKIKTLNVADHDELNACEVAA